MNYQDYVELGLKDDGNLKLILKGNVENNGQNKIGGRQRYLHYKRCCKS